MFNVDKYINTLITLNISERQFLGLYLIYIKRLDLAEKYSKEGLNGMKILPPIEMKELENKGLLVKMANGYILSKKFKELFVDKHIATEDIFRIYPTFLYHQGVQIPLTGMDRNIFANLYIDLIQGSIEEHEEILEDIKYAVEKGMLNIGIEKFLKSQHWKALREHRKKGIEKSNQPNIFNDDF